MGSARLPEGPVSFTGRETPRERVSHGHSSVSSSGQHVAARAASTGHRPSSSWPWPMWNGGTHTLHEQGACRGEGCCPHGSLGSAQSTATSPTKNVTLGDPAFTAVLASGNREATPPSPIVVHVPRVSPSLSKTWPWQGLTDRGRWPAFPQVPGGHGFPGRAAAACWERVRRWPRGGCARGRRGTSPRTWGCEGFGVGQAAEWPRAPHGRRPESADGARSELRVHTWGLPAGPKSRAAGGRPTGGRRWSPGPAACGGAVGTATQPRAPRDAARPRLGQPRLDGRTRQWSPARRPGAAGSQRAEPGSDPPPAEQPRASGRVTHGRLQGTGQAAGAKPAPSLRPVLCLVMRGQDSD